MASAAGVGAQMTAAAIRSLVAEAADVVGMLRVVDPGWRRRQRKWQSELVKHYMKKLIGPSDTNWIECQTLQLLDGVLGCFNCFKGLNFLKVQSFLISELLDRFWKEFHLGPP